MCLSTVGLLIHAGAFDCITCSLSLKMKRGAMLLSGGCEEICRLPSVDKRLCGGNSIHFSSIHFLRAKQRDIWGQKQHKIKWKSNEVDDSFMKTMF